MLLSVSDASSVLPPYTPSSAVPAYSPEPSVDECIIQDRPRTKPHSFTGNYTKNFGCGTLVLTAQDEHADAPTYGRSALIDGFVSLEDRDFVSDVTLKLKANIELRAGSVTDTIILDEKYLLCAPAKIPFSTILPTYFEHKNARYPLPASYFASYASSDGIYAKVSYTLSITITRARRRKLSFRASKTTVVVSFMYRPRTRPARPIPPPESHFLADVKAMPEEWHQLTVAVSPRPKVQLPPVDLHLFTPALDVFAVGERIAVHVQLTGVVSSLREFLPDHDSVVAHATRTPRSLIEARLVRQTRLHIHGSVEVVRVTAGHAVLRPLPPSAHADSSDDGTQASLNWAGELRVDADVATAGSFDAAVLQVQDFIVVDVLEAAGPKSQFAHTRHSRPVRLVTDPCLDPWSDT
ncbi:hypothetical protein B0H14DRAFT_3126987 [Mycena olivaceomarginata]|nr:hypothetical protein B0H14DRAFT_3126987 [Mycena olivaceomarginata]